MFKSMLGFITGVILLYFSGDLINSSKDSLNYYVNLQIVLFCSCFLLLLYSFISNHKFCSSVALYAFFLALGFGYAQFKTDNLKSARISSIYDQQTIQLKAFLCSLPRQGEYFFSADFCLLELKAINGKKLPGQGFKARLKWSLDYEVSNQVGVFYVQSRQPKATVNFIGTSFEENLFYENIVLAGEITERIAVIELSELSFLEQVRYSYHQIRKQVSLYANDVLRETKHKGLIGALLLGDRSSISAQEYKALTNTGTQHLIAISGLHVGLIMVGLYFFLPKTSLSIVLVSVVGIAYVLMVGFSPSAQRAWVMCVCALIYLSGFVRQSKWKPYVLALFLILLLDPLATLNLGFWYSFVCVAIIFTILQFTSIELKKWLSLAVLQILLVIAMVPISSYLGVRHGLENILANIFAIPWISILALPLTLLSFLVSLVSHSLSSVMLGVLDVSLEVLLAYLESLKIFILPIAIEFHGAIVFSYILVFVALLVFHKVKNIVIFFILALVLVTVFPSRLYKPESELLVFDVGQGLAIAIRSQGQIWLYDLGPAFKKSSATQNIILPYLRKHRKSNELTGLIVSHGDADHAGDLRSLYDEFMPDISWSGQPKRLQIKNFEKCIAGMQWHVDKLQIDILYPFQEIYTENLSSNNQSCVVRLTLEETVYLLMGDIEAAAELELVKRYRGDLKADVLIAGHHGAAKSSSFALLKHVKPSVIVFSAGYLNNFGHPAETVLHRAESFGMLILSTEKQGAIAFKSLAEADVFTIKFAR